MKGDASVTFTHEVAPGLHGAIVRATKPADTAAGALTREHVAHPRNMSRIRGLLAELVPSK